MSKETMQWLNENIRVGFDIRPWWADEDSSTHPNLYSGPLSRDMIRNELLGFVPDRESIFDAYGNEIEGYVRLTPSDETSQTGKARSTLGIHTDGYQVHEYKELMTACALDVVSAGLLRERKQFWVQFGKGENVSTPEGVDFMPYIMLSTSLDASQSTQANDGVTLAVCDNTMQFARSEGKRFSIKHSKRSGTTWLADTQAAVSELMRIESETAENIHTLASVEVSEKQWAAFLDIWQPLPEERKTKGGGPGNGWTMANNKRDFMDDLYHNDFRVAPWKGTSLGVVQAANTYKNHNSIVRNAHRAERNLIQAATGKFADHTADTLSKLDKAMAMA